MKPRALALLCLLVATPALAAPGLDPTEAEAVRALEQGDGSLARRVVAERLGGRERGSPEALEAARRAAVLLLAADALEARASAAALAPLFERAERMAPRSRPGDLPLLRALDPALGAARPVLSPLVRGAYEAIGPDLARSELLQLAEDPDDPRARELAVCALAELLAGLREKVLAGRTLDPAEQAAVSDPAQLEVLIDRLADRAGGGATDDIPAGALAGGRGVATALHALANVDAAALPALERAVREGRPGAREALEAVQTFVAQRLRRLPGSTWCSAQGTPPRAITPAPCPGPCAREVPPSAMFCPACGARVRVTCTTCGATTPSSSTHCSSCGARQGEARHLSACGKCRAELPHDAQFCARCGARRPATR